ncbi:MAG: two-component sensor histidine kinase [Acidisphaera sp.]|nr:two-component sensor histidine kinase [Acidisphaera sp.]
MRPALLALAAALLAVVPAAVLAGLIVAGWAAPGPGFAGIALCLLAGLLIALLWRAELRRLHALAREADHLARGAVARAAAIGRQKQADEAIVERLPDPLLVLGVDRTVHRANAAARLAFGADTGAVLRHPLLRAAIDRAQTLGTPQTAELALPVPVAREVHATVIHLPPLPEEGGQTVVVLSDRTRERAVERMREDFVANASHELRTPLASLIGFIDTLRGPAADDPPAQQRFLGIMAEQAARMNRLIDDLLSLSRIELTEHLPPADRVELSVLIPRIVAAFEPRLAARRMAVEVTLDTALPAIVGDADQLAQVLQNLLDNAVKYGREGGRVRLSAAQAVPPRRAGVVVAVADDGPGIARAHLARLTERFYRVDKGRSRSAGGTGLGLAIVKHIVNRHRGQLLIESEEGRGSIFSVWLPLAP